MYRLGSFSVQKHIINISHASCFSACTIKTIIPIDWNINVLWLTVFDLSHFNSPRFFFYIKLRGKKVINFKTIESVWLKIITIIYLMTTPHNFNCNYTEHFCIVTCSSSLIIIARFWIAIEFIIAIIPHLTTI